MKVIFIVPTPFEKRDFKRFGIEILIDQGFSVEVWDLSALTSPIRFQNIQSKEELYRCDGYTAFTTVDSAKKSLKAMKHGEVVLCSLGYEYENLVYWKAISQSQAWVGTRMMAPLPNQDPLAKKVAAHQLIARKLWSFIRNPAKGGLFLFRNTPPWFWGVRRYDFVLASGRRCMEHRRLLGPKTQVVWLHSLDYETYLEEQVQIKTSEKSGYGVFLDQNTPFHPDYAHLGVSPPCTPEQYYPPLRAFFDRIEKYLGKPIVIAAHPRAKYSPSDGYFGHREMIQGQTPSLVRNADFVISHFSTALSHAILLNKPVIFASYEFQSARHEGAAIRAMAHALGKSVYILDGPAFEMDLNQEMKVDVTAYSRYKEDYIKTNGSPLGSAWLAFSKYLKELKV